MFFFVIKRALLPAAYNYSILTKVKSNFFLIWIFFQLSTFYFLAPARLDRFNFASIHCTSVLCYIKDFYETLGVPRNASAKEIKRSYIELAKKYHPDANPGSADAAKKFQEISDAYSVLSNKQKRDTYDGTQARKDPNTDFDPIRRSYQSPYESFHSSVDPEELFRKIFGTDFNVKDRFKKTGKKAWVDFVESDAGFEHTQETIVRLSFREAAKGCEKLITASTLTICDRCAGIGFVICVCCILVLLFCFVVDVNLDIQCNCVRFVMDLALR